MAEGWKVATAAGRAAAMAGRVAAMAARAEVEGANLVGWVAKVALARRASAALPSVARALASFLVGHDPSANPSALTRSAHQASLREARVRGGTGT